MNNIVLTGGGTAGHIMPNIALLPILSKHFDNIYYVGSEKGMEKSISANYGLAYYSTSTIKLTRNKILKNAKIPFILFKSIKEAKSLLKQLMPSVIFSKGGYCSLPSVFAAKSLSIPVICHESDISLGLANRITLPFAKALITSFPDTNKKGICIGTPIRNIIFEGNASLVKSSFNKERPIILVLGGSLGAKAINQCIKKTLPALSNYNILHISGEDIFIDLPNYKNFKFADNIQDYYAAADIVISRAGASTLAELAALGKRTLAIPLPQGASRGDQVVNADYYKKQGLIEVLPQDKLTSYNLVSTIDNMRLSPPPKASYDTLTAQKIVDVILMHSKTVAAIAKHNT